MELLAELLEQGLAVLDALISWDSVRRLFFVWAGWMVLTWVPLALAGYDPTTIDVLPLLGVVVARAYLLGTS